MLPSVRTGVRNLLLKRIKKLRSLQISWFGGEPLMGYDVIEELAPVFHRAAKDNGVFYTGDITTNGYLLTPERSRKLVEWGVRNYQITLDGGPAEHDSHRFLQGGRPTFHQILDNIVAMKDLSQPFSVAVRVNFDNTNVHQLKPLFEILRARIGDDSRFVMRFRPVEQWGGPNDEKLDICGFGDMHRQWIGLSREARQSDLPAEELSEVLDPLRGVCYAARPYSYVVGSDGKLMKCTVVLDTNPANVVGRLSEDGTLHVDEDAHVKWIRPYYKSDTMCAKCFYVPVCQGVCCPLPRILTGERPCPTQKLHIRETLNAVWEEKKSRPENHFVHISAT
jgi:uncharacterized protein